MPWQFAAQLQLPLSRQLAQPTLLMLVLPWHVLAWLVMLPWQFAAQLQLPSLALLALLALRSLVFLVPSLQVLALALPMLLLLALPALLILVQPGQRVPWQVSLLLLLPLVLPFVGLMPRLPRLLVQWMMSLPLGRQQPPPASSSS